MTPKTKDRYQRPRALQRFLRNEADSTFADHSRYCAFAGLETWVTLAGVNAVTPSTKDHNDGRLRFCRTNPPSAAKVVFAKQTQRAQWGRFLRNEADSKFADHSRYCAFDGLETWVAVAGVNAMAPGTKDHNLGRLHFCQSNPPSAAKVVFAKRTDRAGWGRFLRNEPNVAGGVNLCETNPTPASRPRFCRTNPTQPAKGSFTKRTHAMSTC
jgi:hypothetical protein